MREIYFFTQRFFPEIGGVEKHVLSLSKELVKYGYVVHVITFTTENGIPAHEYIDGIVVHRYKIISGGIFKKRFYELRRSVKMFFLLPKDAIIHFHDFGVFLQWIVLIAIFKMLWKNVYITFHGWEGEFPPRRKVKLYRKLCEKIANKNICIGDYIAKWYGTKPDAVSYGATNTTAICSDDNHKDCGFKSIVYVGRLEKDTGIDLYIKAWTNLYKHYSNYTFWVCGAGSLEEELKGKTINVRNIHFCGFVNNPENYVKSADVVLTSGYLGILEAFGLKKPVIATYDNELKKDYLKMWPNSDDLFWMANTVEDIEGCFIDIFQKRNFNGVDNAYKYAKKHNWSNMVKTYFKVWGIDNDF